MVEFVLDKVIVYVRSPARSHAFYQSVLGLTTIFPSRPISEDDYWIEMQSGPTKVALHGGRTTTSSADAPKLAFKVFDFDTTKKYLESCGVVVGQARSPAEGVLVAEFNDPDGNVLSFESHAVESNNKARSS